jgi:hypothetical protein
MPRSLDRSVQPLAGAPLFNVGAHGVWRCCLALLVAVACWLAITRYFWVGYAGADDLFYARYAFLFHREPINWWESRLPAILAMRTAFFWFGPSEFAAALPTLIAAFAGTAAIAWYVRWPQHLNWQTNATVLLAITLPLDATFRTVPGAAYMAAGLLTVGSVCILKGGRFVATAGCACFAAAISTHELSVFYVAIFLGTALALDQRRFLRSVLVSILLALTALGAQSAYYAIKFGDPLLRFRLATAESANVSGLFDPDTRMRGIEFLLWPLKTIVFSKVFACDLLVVFVLGAACWRKLLLDQRIMLISGFLTWLYLGYGTKIPWAYKPLARMYHFYGPLALSVALLLPVCIDHLARRWSRHRRYAITAVAAIVALHLACLAAGGRWGQDVKVSKSLLDFASNHPASTFLTDVATMNQMYVLNGFRLPLNIVCRNGPVVERNLLVNKEPPNPAAPHGVTFPDRAVDGVLLNLSGAFRDDGDFMRFLAEHSGRRERIVPARYKPLFEVAPSFLRGTEFAIASQGAELIGLR